MHDKKCCTHCKTLKPKSEFAKRKSRPDGLDYYCKVCSREMGKKWQRANREKRNAISKRWRERNPEKFKAAQRRRDLRTDFGITPEDYDRMLLAQSGLCAICGKPPDALGSRHTKTLMIDHDHKTGKVRGLLHSQCNLILGYAKDEPAILLSAIQYLARFSCLGDVN